MTNVVDANVMEQSAPPSVHLLVRIELEGKPPREFSYDFRQTVITMGRDPANDIQVPLTTVSRRHARIFFERGDYFLEDLGSTHGTRHNGRKIGKGEKRLLRDGDRIVVMSFQITFTSSAGAILDRKPGEKTEAMARRMVDQMLSSLGGESVDPPRLRVMSGPEEGRQIEIREGIAEITVGRSPECDITLDDHNISRRHCLIKRDWHGFTAQDLGSKNGVLVDGRRIEGLHAIKDGDELQIGGIKLTFIDPASRFLDQMGGLNNETMDGAAGPETADLDSPEEPIDEPQVVAPDEPEYPPMEDPSPGMDVEPPPLGEPDDFVAPDPEVVKRVDEVLSTVEKKSMTFEVVVLLLGALFLLASAGVLVFLFM